MKVVHPVARFVLQTLILSASCALLAQGPPGQDRDNPPPGHGGMPPGQAKKHGYDEDHMPPGQAKKYRFHYEDRDHFYAYYRKDAERWRGHHRPAILPGHYVPQDYVVQAVPTSYWEGAIPPPPPGYRFGYLNGYVVAYDPTTRMIADVLDLVAASTSR